MVDIASGQPGRFRHAVFLDRDGTITRDTHYPHRVSELRFERGAEAGLLRLASLPAYIVVVTNQAGIAQGRFTVEEMHVYNTELCVRAVALGARIDAVLYCPHEESFRLPEGAEPCECSKPKPGMLFEAADLLGIELGGSVMIGDKSSDVLAGQAAGCKSALVLTGNGGKEENALPFRADGVFPTLRDAAEWAAVLLGRAAPDGL